MYVQQQATVLLLGNYGVGKSTFFSKLTRSTDHSVYMRYFLEENEEVVLRVDDTCGEEQFHSLPPCYFKQIDGVLLFFSLEEKKSFQDLQYWLDIIEMHINPMPVIILIGTKNDLRSHVDNDDIQQFIIGQGQYCLFYRINYLSKVDQIIWQMAKQIYYNRKELSPARKRSFSLQSFAPKTKKSNCFC